MVKQGCFEAELVDAETGQVFKEHVKDDKVFSECEPEREFFIRVKLCAPDDTEHFQGEYEAHYVVDNQDLGYHQYFRAGDVLQAGSRSTSEDGIVTKHALRFLKARTNTITGTTTLQKFLSVCGKIQIRFYRTHRTGRSKYVESRKACATNLFPEECVHVAANAEYRDKLLRSTKGATELSSKKKSGWRPIYERGQYVDTIAIYYCSCVGLIRAGVLPSPGMYKMHKMVEAYKALPRSSGSKRGRADGEIPTIVTPESKKHRGADGDDSTAYL